MAALIFGPSPLAILIGAVLPWRAVVVIVSLLMIGSVVLAAFPDRVIPELEENGFDVLVVFLPLWGLLTGSFLFLGRLLRTLSDRWLRSG